jgi:hypothetical protein
MAPTKQKTINELLDAWYPVAKQLSDLTLKEKELRKEIFARAFPSPELGTNKVKIDHGMALIGDYRMNYKIDRPMMEQTISMLRQTTGVEAQQQVALIENLITYRPEVRPGEFKKLTPEGFKVVGSFITQTPGTPGLEVKPQSKVRW